ncbi:MAG: GNAT family N-acetyltransferase [Saprospiraceae bacterium]|nr:GNAT family N-acetyltransferase [Saprospiraceae bacterium]
MIPYVIEENRLDDAMLVIRQIPEFENIPEADRILSRLVNTPHLILSASIDSVPIGFKIGYERDGMFYSWLGGILPEYRNKGIASALAEKQEEWAKTHGYTTIWMKTRNCFPEMLMMAIGRGFRIIGFDPREEVGQHRIVLEKSI